MITKAIEHNQKEVAFDYYERIKSMKIITTPVKVTPEEREVLINIYPDEDSKLWAEIDTTIQKYANKCIKQGWEQISETRHTDGSWQGATFRAPASAISIRNPNAKRTRTMTEEQRLEASQRLRLAREKKMSRNDGVKDNDIGDGNDDDNDIDEFG